MTLSDGIRLPVEVAYLSRVSDDDVLFLVLNGLDAGDRVTGYSWREVGRYWLLWPDDLAFASDPQRYATVCIANATTATVIFQHAWGNGEWNRISLSPGHRRVFWHRLSADNTAPVPRVRFDNSFLSGYQQQDYRLEFYASDDSDSCESARRYRFTPDGIDITLVGLR